MTQALPFQPIVLPNCVPHAILPIDTQTADGPPRFATVTLSSDDDLSGSCTVHNKTFSSASQGWFSTYAMGIDTPSERDRAYDRMWSAIVSSHSLVAITLGNPQVRTRRHALGIATRDAIGWVFFPPSPEPRGVPMTTTSAHLAGFGDLPDARFWPMLRLRPATTAHERLAVAQRVRDDLAFFFHTRESRSIAPPLFL